MSTVFHRAIDSCENLDEGFETIIELGFNKVLTSGGCISATRGKEVISSLHQKYGNKIIIMPGGGVRSDNVSDLIRISSCTEFHSSALTANNTNYLADENEIKALKAKLN